MTREVSLRVTDSERQIEGIEYSVQTNAVAVRGGCFRATGGDNRNFGAAKKRTSG
jgi:hypothetical protein